VDENEGGGLLGLALGIGMGVWSTAGDGGIGVGLLAILLIAGSIAWLSASVL
jgi:hypothetical protein